MVDQTHKLRDILLAFVPVDGTTIGNATLRAVFCRQSTSLGIDVDDDVYWSVRDALVEEGVLIKGMGRGGSVRRAVTDAQGALMLVLERTVRPPGLSGQWQSRASLQFDALQPQVERIIDDALASGDLAAMQRALKALKRLFDLTSPPDTAPGRPQ